ncbi:BspA family leucine-rich repeat surface protein [Enterococcus faecalis]
MKNRSLSLILLTTVLFSHSMLSSITVNAENDLTTEPTESVSSHVIEKSEEDIPEEKSSIPEAMDWDLVDNGNTITLTNYKGNATDIEIPGEIDGKQVIITRAALASLPVNLTTINVKEVNGKKVQVSGSSLTAVFKDRKHLTNANLQGLDVSNVTDFGGLFAGSSVNSIDLTGWDTSQAQNMYTMFKDCSNLTMLNAANLNTSNVTNMSFMFAGTANLTTLDVSNWNTSKVTTMSNLFNGASSLTTLDVSGWDTANVTNMDYMFSDTSNLTNLDVSNWNTSKVTTMYAMFKGTSNLTNLNVSNWDTSKVINMSYMFNNSKSLTSLDVSSWDTSSVTNMSSLFSNCTNLTTLDVSNWNTSNVTNMGSLFSNCVNLAELNVSNWDTSNVTNMSYLFFRNSNIESLDVSNWNTAKVQKMYALFNGASNLANIDLKNWDTSSVINMGYMFANTFKLNYLDLSNFNLNQASVITNLFKIDEEFLADNLFTIRQLLVVTKDETLKNYDYIADNRIPAGPILDANGGIFKDGSAIKPLFETFVVESLGQAVIDKQQYENLLKENIPTKVDATFIKWTSEKDRTNNPQRNADTVISIVDKLNEVLYAQWYEGNQVILPGIDNTEGTSDDVVVKPGPDSGTPSKDNHGNVIVPEGGSVVLPGGIEITPPANSVVVPGGTVVQPNKDGEQPIVNEDGTVIVPNGGEVILPNGQVVTPPNGSVVQSNGNIVTSEGQITRPDGTTEKPNADIKPEIDNETSGILNESKPEQSKPNNGTVMPGVNTESNSSNGSNSSFIGNSQQNSVSITNSAQTDKKGQQEKINGKKLLPNTGEIMGNYGLFGAMLLALAGGLTVIKRKAKR